MPRKRRLDDAYIPDAKNFRSIELDDLPPEILHYIATLMEPLDACRMAQTSCFWSSLLMDPKIIEKRKDASLRVIEKTYSNGKLFQQFSFLPNGNQHGLSKIFHENGELSESQKWENGERHGVRQWWRKNTVLKQREELKNGKRHGVRRTQRFYCLSSLGMDTADPGPLFVCHFTIQTPTLRQ